jgi:hypothetical protein
MVMDAELPVRGDFCFEQLKISFCGQNFPKA